MNFMLQDSQIAVIIGASGGIGAALTAALQTRLGADRVIALSRSSSPMLDLTDEASIAAAAAYVKADGRSIGLVFDATGYLHGQGFMPERSWRELDAEHLALDYAINTIGPALLMKHFLPVLPRQGRSIFATLSARVGSISDNKLGGWHSYRASKAALNQMVRTCSVELKRKKPEAICIAMHPGTVRSALSEPFSKSGLDVRAPKTAAEDLLRVLDGLSVTDSGHLFDHKAERIDF
ncbi:MAG: SDR family NAD(P)-dependent oxidoreductase [Alphaproteobacteria bacterium]|nr:SDR family NAD(P)-dependent oxidoreductase [Alphaproteobacteria bacterium]